MGRRAIVAAFFAALALPIAVPVAAWRAAPAEAAVSDAGFQAYALAGSDEFRIGDDAVTSEVTFRGSQQLTWHPRPPGTRFDSHVDYARTEQGADAAAHAHYVSDLLPTGEQRDRIAEDPEYLSILNQPFSVRLDIATLGDLRRLHSDVPFDFPSPMTGSTMHGRLRHLGEAMMGGKSAVGVGFAAAGTMSGSLPDRPGLAIVGAIVLRGTAYYDAHTALLLACQTTVTIVGNVTNPGNTDAVRITYVRAIRAGTAPVGPVPSASHVPDASATPAAPAATPAPAASVTPNAAGVSQRAG